MEQFIGRDNHSDIKSFSLGKLGQTTTMRGLALNMPKTSQIQFNRVKSNQMVPNLGALINSISINQQKIENTFQTPLALPNGQRRSSNIGANRISLETTTQSKPADNRKAPENKKSFDLNDLI